MGAIVAEQHRVGIIHFALIVNSEVSCRIVGRRDTLFDLAVHLDQILDTLQDPARLSSSSPATAASC